MAGRGGSFAPPPGRDATLFTAEALSQFGRGPCRITKENAMLHVQIHDYARKLLEARGTEAIAEASQKAIGLEKEGLTEEARNWRQIAEAMKQMRGPHQS
jgi:hypothetical protein